tara:strand:+ start:34 stop:774 length:741 start_codon:yes stop_codon:yes gene_type:complete
MKFKEEFYNGADLLVQSNDSKYQDIKERYKEIKELLTNITDSEIKGPFDAYCKKIYKNYPDLPDLTKPYKSPQWIINKVIKEKFIEYGWDSETPIYYKKDENGKEDNKDLEKLRMDFSKCPIAMEVSFNHGSDIEHNLFKPWLAIADTGITKVIKDFKLGVIITPTKALKLNANMDSAVGSFEKWKLFFKLFEKLNLGNYVLIGLSPFKTFKVQQKKQSIPQKSKKTGKVIKPKEGKLLKVWTENL